MSLELLPTPLIVENRYQMYKQVYKSVWSVYRLWIPNVYCKAINLAVSKQMLRCVNMHNTNQFASTAIINTSVIWS